MRIETEMGNFTLEATPYLKAGKTTRLKILYMDYASTTERYKKKLDIDFADKKSNVMFLMFKDVNKVRGKAFLSAVIDSYNKYSLEEKNRDAVIMENFLNKRIHIIQEDLARGDLQIEDFKEQNKLTDLGTEMKIMLERSTSVKERRLAVEKQIALLQTTRAFVTDPENKYALIPLTLGTTNGELSGVLSSYNGLLSERQILLRSTNLENPTIVRLDDRLNTIRETMILTIDNSLKVVQKTLSEINDEENKMMDKLENVPLIERQFYTLQRDNQVSNAMYLYLLQQQAQNDMKLNSDAPKTQIIDKAYAATRPSSPKPLIVLAAAFIMALILPVIYLRFHRAVKPRVDNAFELSQLLPATAIYQLHDEQPNDLHQEVDDTYRNDLRNLRSEIDWTKTEPGCGKVLVVAGMERETGKTKMAFHLAESIAQTQRRVLLIDADLRYSKLGATPMGHTDKQRTLVPMLEQHRTTLDASALFSPNAALPYLQMIPATDGLQNSVPAADLLQSPQWNDLLAWARQNYEAIVIDTTALNQYPDTLPLLQQADSNYFIFTAGRSTKQSVAQLKTLVDDEQTHDLHLILNVSNRVS
jgi:Mrp family chromosome partitioning ATPase